METTRRAAYETTIRETLARIGRIGAADPALIECWMRLEHPTLDALSRRDFEREVGIALECIAEAGAEQNAALAESYGFAQSQVAR